MHIARFAGDDDPQFGLIGDDKGVPTIGILKGDPLYAGFELAGRKIPLDDVRLLAPVIPRSKVVCVGINYLGHAAEMGGDVPDEPLIFLKPNTSVIGPGEPILYPSQSTDVHYEGELAVVIGRICRDVSAEDASKVIFGYTVANDVTARDLQAKDGQWARAKGFDTFCPLGPWIETDLDPSNLQVSTALNDETEAGRSHVRHGLLGARDRRVRLELHDAPARRRHPHRHSRRRRTDERRRHRRRHGRGHRHAHQPGDGA